MGDNPPKPPNPPDPPPDSLNLSFPMTTDPPEIDFTQAHFRDVFCTSVRVKINMTYKAIDRIKIFTGFNSSITAFVHYEKNNKMCAYCVGFFHNANNCRN
jgi:hypothetical protein